MEMTNIKKIHITSESFASPYPLKYFEKKYSVSI